jgi:NADH:ubiquinone oxidoreductase subunit 6 (subunit J)
MPMAFMEKSNWVVLIVAVPTLLVYAALVVPQVVSTPLAEVAWVQPMIFAIVGFIVANVLGNVVAAASNPGEADKNDQRDQEISHYGERIGSWLIIAGSIAALVLAMAMADHFWIANAIFLGGIAASIVSSGAKIAAYRGSFQAW